MKERTGVHGSQAVRPRPIEFNHNTVYGRRHIQRIEVPLNGEEGETTKMWMYDECELYRFEYDQVCNGTPAGGAWTDFLRWFERGAMLDSADTLLAEANDHLILGDPDGRWTKYRDAMIHYKEAIRASKAQPNYPQIVEYPELPTQPE